MKQEEVILFAKASDFVNDDGKRIQSGKIYILGNRSDKTTDYGRSVGHQVAEQKCSYELAKEIQKAVPGVYAVEYDVNINRDNAFTLSVVGAALVHEVEILKSLKIK